MEGTSFGDVPLNIELKLEVWDSPNSAGIVIDAVRMAKLALNNGIAGALEGPSSYLMKSPPVQIVDDEAYEATEKFIAQNALKKTKASGLGVIAWVGSGAMATVALEPASRLTHAELAEIFNAGYEGYYMPFTLDEDTFRFMSRIWDDDLDASRSRSSTASRPASASWRFAATAAGSRASGSRPRTVDRAWARS